MKFESISLHKTFLKVYAMGFFQHPAKQQRDSHVAISYVLMLHTRKITA